MADSRQTEELARKCIENVIQETFKGRSELVKISEFYVIHTVNILAFNISTSKGT
jgi:hypothetical protein